MLSKLLLLNHKITKETRRSFWDSFFSSYTIALCFSATINRSSQTGYTSVVKSPFCLLFQVLKIMVTWMRLTTWSLET